MPNPALRPSGSHMIDKIEETNRSRSLSYLLGDGLAILQAFAPDFASIYDGYLLYVGRDVGVETFEVRTCPLCNVTVRGAVADSVVRIV